VPAETTAVALRHDIVAEAIGDDVVLRDPTSNRYFRVGHAEYDVLADPHAEASPFTDVVRQTAAAAGLLESSAPPARRRVTRLSWWFIHIELGDPANTLVRQRRWLGVGGLWGVVTGLTCLSAVVATLAAQRGGTGMLLRLPHTALWLLLPIYVLVAASLLLHEWAHASALSLAGRTSHRIGVVFVLLLPIGYCDGKEAWLIEDRRRRAMVALAGPWMNLVLFGLCWYGATVFHGVLLLRLAQANATAGTLNLLPVPRLDGHRLIQFVFGRNATRGIDAAVSRVLSTLNRFAMGVQGAVGV